MTKSPGASTSRSFASVNGHITPLEDARVPVLERDYTDGIVVSAVDVTFTARFRSRTS